MYLLVLGTQAICHSHNVSKRVSASKRLGAARQLSSTPVPPFCRPWKPNTVRLNQQGCMRTIGFATTVDWEVYKSLLNWWGASLRL